MSCVPTTQPPAQKNGENWIFFYPTFLKIQNGRYSYLLLFVLLLQIRTTNLRLGKNGRQSLTHFARTQQPAHEIVKIEFFSNSKFW